jgi:tetratricopeptide (TPR) repeat protein
VDLRIVLAGRVGLEAGGEAVPDPGLGSLGRLTLAFLVVERHRPVSCDELAEVLWGDSVPATWRSALRGLVSKVRELLSSGGVDRAEAVASGSGWYQLRLPPGAVVDVEAAVSDLASAPDDALRLAAALGRFWEVRGHIGEGRFWLARALAAATPGSDGVRGRACVAAATLAQRQGDLAAARTSHPEALALARSGGDVAAEAMALHGLGLLDALAGDASGARSRYLNSLAIGRQLGSPSIVATALTNLGWLSYNQSDFPAARSMLEESLRIQRTEGLGYGAAWSWYFLGRLAESEGDLAHARACHEEGLALRRELDDRSGVADSLAALGSVALHHGDRTSARGCAEASLAVRRELGDRSGALESLRLLGDVARLDGESAAAEGWYRESLALAEELDDRCCASRARVRLAVLARACDRHDQARVLLHQATPAGGPPDAVLVEWVEGVGALAVDGGHVEVGARLLGAAAGLRSSIGVPIPVAERAGHDDHLTCARRVLGQHAWAAATAAGRSMALEEMLGCSRAQVAP